jgi:hypothetical protein
MIEESEDEDEFKPDDEGESRIIEKKEDEDDKD